MKGFLWNLKTRLQFTGWLQYVLTAVAALAFLFVATLGWLVGQWPALLFWPPLIIGSLLLLAAVFDVITLKFGFRPSERLPERKDDLDAFDLMRSRRSCRSFQTRDLTPADHAELMDVVGEQSQPNRLLGDRPIRFEYAAAPLTVWPVVGGHEFLVAIAPREYNRLAVIDVGRCLQRIVLHATRMGLGTCWIGPGANHESVIRHLGDRFDTEQDHIICVCAVGYTSKFWPLSVRGISLLMHRRLPLTDLFFAGPHFLEPLDVEAEPFKLFGRCYEACQWSPSSFNAQPTRCAAVMERSEGEDEESLMRFDFCASTASRYYAAVALGIWCTNWETGCEALGIRGHAAVLTPEQRGAQGAPELPRYDVSWMVDRSA